MLVIIIKKLEMREITSEHKLFFFRNEKNQSLIGNNKTEKNCINYLFSAEAVAV